MINKKYLSICLITLIILLAGNKADAQNILFQEDFETSPVTSITNWNTSDLPDGGSPCGRASRGTTSDFNSANVDYNNSENATYFLGLNPESPCGGYYSATLETSTLDLSGNSELYFKCRYFIGSNLGWGLTSIGVEFNNGTDTHTISSEFSVTNTWTEFEVALPASMISTTVDVTITFAGGDGLGLDDFTIQDGPSGSCVDTSSSTSEEACESYEWNGTTYTTSGTYSEMFTNAAGCDSTATLNLTILEPTSSEATISECESYDWNGATYTTSGTYSEMFTNAAGCDSTATLNLTILEATSSEATISECESYDWNGTTYTTSGTYSEMFTNAAGCDSTATLNLTILEPTSSEATISECESYEWNGTTYTASGTYSEMFTNAAGCDSTATLNLTILEATAGEESVDACGSYDWNNNTYTESGSYEAILVNAVGCDSTATLHLTINELPVATVEVDGSVLSAPEGQGLLYQWFDCSTNQAIEGETERQLTASGQASYYVEVSNDQCTAISDCFTANNPLAADTGITELTIYPNPAIDKITIHGINKDHNYELINLSGKIVQRGKTVNHALDLNVEAGVYFVVIEKGDQINRLKVVVKQRN